MGRWEPEAQGRLRVAAMELFLDRGYEQTTVAEIAGRAGLTARTFFRYYADKREVLFGGAATFQEQVVEALDAVPPSAAPMAAAATALDAAAAFIGAQPENARLRQRVITANAELRERELVKMATLAEALAEGLRSRGVPDLDAVLTAQVAVSVLQVAFERWVARPGQDLAAVMRECLERLRFLAATSRSR